MITSVIYVLSKMRAVDFNRKTVVLNYLGQYFGSLGFCTCSCTCENAVDFAHPVTHSFCEWLQLII